MRTRGCPAGLMRGPPLAFGVLVELQPEPARVATDAGADRNGVLADAAGEHHGVEPAERRRERAELAADAVDEQVHRLGGARRRSCRAALACRWRSPETPSNPDCS